MNYHAHIYFDSNSLTKAQTFHALHIKHKIDYGFWVGKMIDYKVGPHPMPMFEVHVSSQHSQNYIDFIEKNRDGLDILLHEDTGNDLKDHTDGARWFGKKLELDFTAF